MCIYTPKATKKGSHSSSYGTKASTRSNSSRNRHRQTMPRNIIVKQPAPQPPPAVIIPQYPQHQQPRIEVVGEGEATNIYLLSPAPTQGSQFQGQGDGQNGQNGKQTNQSNGQERRTSSLIVAEVEGVMRLARRVGDAVRRGSASSFSRRHSYHREERLRERSRERRSGWRRSRESSRSKERSRSREKRTGKKELGAVDEEARKMARYAGELSSSLVRERDIKMEAKRLAQKKREDEERLADRVLSRYGPGGLITPPIGPPRGRDWRDGVSWAPWNAAAYGSNQYIQPPPPAQPPATSNGASGSGSEDGNARKKDRSEASGGASNHIHVHTAPLVQGPQISTTTPGSSGGYAEMPGMVANANLVGQRRSSWVEPMRNITRMIERGMGGYGMGGAGLGLGMGMGGLGVNSMSGMTPIHGMGAAGAVPVGEREWQRARMYSNHGDAGMGGMMY